MDTGRRQIEEIEPQIGLWDAVSIIIGIIIGVGIFETPPKIFEAAPGPWEAMGVWVLGGLLALVGALCFAELASTYPRSGGEYVYLSRAFGPRIGFLYSWAQLAVIRPASIAALGFIFAEYAGRLWGLQGAWLPEKFGLVWLAAAPLVLLTLINILGVTLSTHAQNLLTVAKLAGLVFLGLAGCFWATPHEPSAAAHTPSANWFASAMIFALWTYSGWHEAAYVAAEIKDSRRKLPLALLLGTAAVTVIYLLVNVAILAGLGFDAARHSQAVAVELLAAILGESAGRVIDVVVMISALGAINGMIFTTARIYAAFGRDHGLFYSLAHWSRRWGTPVRALVAQGVLSLAYVIGVTLFWTQGGFDDLVFGTTPVFWLFFLLTGIGLFMLRNKDADLPRPFRVPLYPLLPLLFCGMCGYMIVGSILLAPKQSLFGLGVLVVGLPFCFLSGPPARRRHKPDPGLLTPAPEPKAPHLV